jgi:hypothetical protein
VPFNPSISGRLFIDSRSNCFDFSSFTHLHITVVAGTDVTNTDALRTSALFIMHSVRLPANLTNVEIGRLMTDPNASQAISSTDVCMSSVKACKGMPLGSNPHFTLNFVITVHIYGVYTPIYSEFV